MPANNQVNQSSINVDVLSPTYQADHIACVNAVLSASATPVSEPARIDVNLGHDVVVGSHVKLSPLRESIVAQLGAQAGVAIDRMPLLARGALQADIELQRWVASGNLRDMHQEVIDARHVLANACETLVHRKLVRPEEFAGAQEIRGYKAIGRSVGVLISWVLDNWELVEAHTKLTRDDVTHAQEAADRLRDAVALRDQGAKTSPVEDYRNRAVTALVRNYEEVRRIVQYVRYYERDSEELAPSMFQKGTGKGPTDDGSDPPVTPEPTGPTEPEMDPTAPGGPFSP